MKIIAITSLLLLLAASTVKCFVLHNTASKAATSVRRNSLQEIIIPLYAKYEGPGEDIADAFDRKSSLDSDVRARLLAESIAPWRNLRLFIYLSAGSGAGLGGLITLTSLAAASVNPDVNVVEIYKNLAIDFGVVAVCGVAAKLDLDKGAELNTKVEHKMKRKAEMKVLKQEMKGRETILGQLDLNIRISEEGDVRTAPIKALQSGAKQHIIIVAGNKSYTRDALFGAKLVQREVFARGNTLIVPYTLDEEDRKGFGERAEEKQAYVAQPSGEGWEEFIEAEFTDAIKQGVENAKEQGVAIVCKNDGTIIRRGLGMVPWKVTVDELNGIEVEA